ncbi:hypothetical protein [Nostoc sp.]|uniref:hypothetical protein n=1 Tax=Nostoc sp. TaxID=1180 RepID=UPI003594381B
MSKLNLQYLKKNLKYEVDYLLSKFKLSQAAIFIITLFCLVVTGLGDTTSFFNSNSSFIPKDWTWLNSKNFVNLLDLSKMEDYKLHSDALDWIIGRSKAVKWIWRIKNNV